MNQRIPKEVDVVVVGGGIVGCSIAYHLTRMGCPDVWVLEQGGVAGGTTWHAAGLIGRLRTTTSMTKINQYSAELYSQLERETGHSVGWKQVGSLIVGKSRERMQQLARTAAMAEWFGVQVDLISASQAQEKWPLLRVDDVLGAAWLPHDGKLIPKEVALALAAGAKQKGAQILENIRVTGVMHRDGRATGVRVESRHEPDVEHEIGARIVVLAGGMWTRELGLGCGVNIPLYPVEHHYVVSKPIEGAYDHLPVGRDPDLCIYFRGEGQSVMLGAFQAHSKPWEVSRIPDPFSFQLLPPDWEKFSEPLAHGKHRIPALETSGFEKFVNGPESFTPDNNFILGEAPELRQLFVAAGFNSVGIASAGGAGKYLAEWILGGEPSLDLWSVDIRRFGAWANNRQFLKSRVAEVLGLHYQMAWPNREMETGRGVRLSPLHERLAEAGACFGVKAGWERPNWFANDGQRAEVQYSFERQNWFANQGEEHRATREHVALFDQTAFGKLRVAGPAAASFLQRMCGNNVDVAVGKAVYTGMFNPRGGFESDLTVIRLKREEYLLVTGSTQAGRDLDWLLRNRQPEERVDVADVTGSRAVVGVMGPSSRELLSRLSEDVDWSLAGFPFGTARTVDLGLARVLAVRITYVGELGWELYVPVEQALGLYDALMAAGQDLGVKPAGHYAIQSLRLEKGYRAWGAELSPDDSPLEAGLGFAVDWSKAFLGSEALGRLRGRPLSRMLGIFVLEDPGPVLWGSELILRDGRPVGYTTSGSYGHTLGGGIGMGYVKDERGLDAEKVVQGRYEILVNGDRVPAKIHVRPPWDPARGRILV